MGEERRRKPTHDEARAICLEGSDDLYRHLFPPRSKDLVLSDADRLRRVAADCRATVSGMWENAQRENRPRSSANDLRDKNK